MNMTKEKLNKILDRLDYWNTLDRKLQEAMDNFAGAFSGEGEYLVINDAHASSFIDGVALSYPRLKDYLEYYVWELPHMDDEDDTGIIGDKKYNLKNRDEFIDFVLEAGSVDAKDTEHTTNLEEILGMS